MKIRIYHKHNGSFVYEHEEEKNSLKITLEKALEEGVKFNPDDLSYVHILGADDSGSHVYLLDAYVDKDHLTNENFYKY